MCRTERSPGLLLPHVFAALQCNVLPVGGQKHALSQSRDRTATGSAAPDLPSAVRGGVCPLPVVISPGWETKGESKVNRRCLKTFLRRPPPLQRQAVREFRNLGGRTGSPRLLVGTVP